MAKRLFVEQQNGRVVRKRSRFSGHGGDRANRALRGEARNERHEGLSLRAQVLQKLDDADACSLVAGDDAAVAVSPLGETVRDHGFGTCDEDRVYVNGAYDPSTGQVSFASCGRSRRWR